MAQTKRQTACAICTNVVVVPDLDKGYLLMIVLALLPRPQNVYKRNLWSRLIALPCLRAIIFFEAASRLLQSTAKLRALWCVASSLSASRQTPEHDGLDAILRPPREHAEEVDPEQPGHFGRSTQQVQLVHNRKAHLGHSKRATSMRGFGKDKEGEREGIAQ